MAVYSDIIKTSYIATEVRRYDFAFNIISKESLSVFISDDTQLLDRKLQYIMDYDIELNHDNIGGYITITDIGRDKIKVGAKITLVHTPSFIQDIKLQENDTLYIKTIEDMVDKLTYITLSLKERLDRAMLTPIGMSDNFVYTDMLKLADDCGRLAKEAKTFADATAIDLAKVVAIESELQKMKVELNNFIAKATIEEAIAGVNTDKMMTPLLVKSFVDDKNFTTLTAVSTLIDSKNFATKAEGFITYPLNGIDINVIDNNGGNYIVDCSSGQVSIFATPWAKVIQFGKFYAQTSFYFQLALNVSSLEIALRSRMAAASTWSAWKKW